MLNTIALIIIFGIILGALLKKLRLPSLLGMILTGIILGPHMFNLIDSSILDISSDIRQIALVIILTRAGLALDTKDLKLIGRPAILMCFIPALFEIIGFIILGPKLFNLTLLDSAILGTTIAAVSPAVIVPKMLNLMESGYGVNKRIPQLILAGASVDDIFVIVLFTALTSIAKTKAELSAKILFEIPISITLGILLGILAGIFLTYIFKKIHTRDSNKILIILSTSFFFLTIENQLKGIVPISGLLAVMSLGSTILKLYEPLAKRISIKYSKLWVAAEIFLFVLVGASIDISYALKLGVFSIIILIGTLIFRFLGVYISLLKTNLSNKEKIFIAFSYMPKATVQAAIGGIPLSMGIASGEIILTIAVVSILLTAPIGAILIDSTYKKLLSK
ncbi:MAG: sodium:proton antiporter [Clostridium sartagoforme]|nr:sodium:proton antiporter [Clostridium sartagoforme]